MQYLRTPIWSLVLLSLSLYTNFFDKLIIGTLRSMLTICIARRTHSFSFNHFRMKILAISSFPQLTEPCSQAPEQYSLSPPGPCLSAHKLC